MPGLDDAATIAVMGCMGAKPGESMLIIEERAADAA